MMVDTNVLIDLREQDSAWFEWSFSAMSTGLQFGLTASAIVIGEIMSRGGAETDVLAQLSYFRIEPAPLPIAAGIRAGAAHHAYRCAGGTRERLLADFLIGAHAAIEAKPLITRDSRRYRSYFPELTLITPETHPHG